MGSDKVYVRGRSGRVKSCPTRTLDNFPMEYSYSDLTRSVFQLRSARIIENEHMYFLQRSSMNQKDYSRRMFEHAIEKEMKAKISRKLPIKTGEIKSGNGVLCEIYELHNSPRTTCWDLPINSGPSSFGSPLYNKKAELMNQIRTRGKSELLPSLLNHIRGTPEWEDLGKHIKTLNDRFKVQRINTYHTYNDEEFVGENYSLVPVNTIEGTSKESEEQIENEIKVLAASEYEEEREKDNSQIAQIDFPVVKIEAPDGESLEIVDPKTDTKDAQRVRNSREKSGSSKSRPKSNSRVTTSRSHSCWVDTATVSSNEQAEKEPEQPETLLNVPGKKRSRSKAGSRKAASLRSNRSARSTKSNNKGKKSAKETKTVTIKCETSITEDKKHKEEEESQEIKFPDFICPSSEDKSKQAAVKMWLGQISLPLSCRHVPLL